MKALNENLLSFSKHEKVLLNVFYLPVIVKYLTGINCNWVGEMSLWHNLHGGSLIYFQFHYSCIAYLS
jgi:hypothetical protein